MSVSNQLKEAYASQYDQSTTAWRRLGAKYKALNISVLSKNIDFKNVCEVGCGEGSILQYLSEMTFCQAMYGLEISETGIAATKSKQIKQLLDVRLFDGYQIPYPDDYFDLLICSHVIEHVEHPRLLLREIKRVSKYQIFEVPIDFSFYVDKKLQHFLAYGHINIFTPALFRFLLRSENFEVLKDRCSLYTNDVLRHLYKNDKLGFWWMKIKQFVIAAIPYLKGIKPQAYTVLTQKTNGGIKIF